MRQIPEDHPLYVAAKARVEADERLKAVSDILLCREFLEDSWWIAVAEYPDAEALVDLADDIRACGEALTPQRPEEEVE